MSTEKNYLNKTNHKDLNYLQGKNRPLIKGGEDKKVIVDLKKYPYFMIWYAVQGLICNSDIIRLDLNQDEEGGHVHARETKNGVKIIDGTYSTVDMYYGENKIATITPDILRTSRMEAFGHYSTNLEGIKEEIKNKIKYFSQNSIVVPKTDLITPNNKLVLDLSNLGDKHKLFAIIATTPSFLATSLSGQIRLEETGVHYHSYDFEGKVLIDNTYSQVDIIIDGIEYKIIPEELNLFCLQRDLKKTKEYENLTVGSANCPKCGKPVLSQEKFANQLSHICNHCQTLFKTTEECTLNPIVLVLNKIDETKFNETN